MRKIELVRDVSLDVLKKNYKKEKNHRIKLRILMLIHVKEGKSATQIGKILKCSHNTIITQIRRFNEFGFEGLFDKVRSGSPSKVNHGELKEILEQSPKDFGYPHEVWFPRLVYNYILDFQKVQIAPEYVYELIRNLGYTLVVPREKSYKSDPEKVKLFKKKLRKSLKT